MNEIPSFEKKPESSGEEPREKLPIDEHIFDRLDALSEGVADREKQKVFEESVIQVKRGAFDIFEETLDRLSGEEMPEKPSDREKKEHGILGHLNSVGISVQRYANERPSWISEKDPNKLRQPIERASFIYVSDLLSRYEKAVHDKQDPKKILRDLRLSNVIDSAYIENHFLKKINKLPLMIRENLFKIHR